MSGWPEIKAFLWNKYLCIESVHIKLV